MSIIAREKKEQKYRGGRNGLYAEWLEPDGLLQIKGWARDGLTDAEICKQIGIAEGTWYRWLKDYAEIREAVKKGRRPVAVEVEDTLIDKKLNGYFVDEEIIEVTTHPDGSQTKHKRIYKRFIPPDTTAMIFYLKCKKGRLYNDRVNLNIEAEAVDGKLDKLIEAVKDVK